eukprot:360434-Chlamydomonas_euryale.AAC.1
MTRINEKTLLSKLSLWRQDLTRRDNNSSLRLAPPIESMRACAADGAGCGFVWGATCRLPDLNDKWRTRGTGVDGTPGPNSCPATAPHGGLPRGGGPVRVQSQGGPEEASVYEAVRGEVGGGGKPPPLFLTRQEVRGAQQGGAGGAHKSLQSWQSLMQTQNAAQSRNHPNHPNLSYLGVQTLNVAQFLKQAGCLF